MNLATNRHECCEEKSLKGQIIGLLLLLYRFKWSRKQITRVISALESGEFYSESLRTIEQRYYGVTVGEYSYGYLENNPNLPYGTTIGRFCSLAAGLKIFRRNHPSQRPSTHPFFYNAKLGLVKEDTIISEHENSLVIENDVWIGDRVTVLPNCKSIGNGAIVGAGSVVTKDIPAYAIVVGNPAEVKRFRFEEEIIELLQESEWWQLSLQELGPVLNYFVEDLNYEKAEELKNFCITKKN